MPATTFNRVSIHAMSIDESVPFYANAFGMKQIPHPVCRQRVAWLLVGAQELHLFERDTPAPRLQRFALTVDDFEAVHVRAKTGEGVGPRRAGAPALTV